MTYLVFGDLHGRILPAFQLAKAWSKDHQRKVTGLLQVGDVGYFPNPLQLDKATKRHAEKDPLELGATLVASESREADAVFHGPSADLLPEAIWCTLGNHEDYAAIFERESQSTRQSSSFLLDVYGRVRCIKNGQVESLPGELRVGALWGIDGNSSKSRRKPSDHIVISEKAVYQLQASKFNVLLSHDSPRDAIFPESGSWEIQWIIEHVRPEFAFFGHYHGGMGRIEGSFGKTQVFHMEGFELRGPGKTAEPGSVGVLAWNGQKWDFEYLDPQWLLRFHRYNWKFF